MVWCCNSWNIWACTRQNPDSILDIHSNSPFSISVTSCWVSQSFLVENLDHFLLSISVTSCWASQSLLVENLDHFLLSISVTSSCWASQSLVLVEHLRAPPPRELNPVSTSLLASQTQKQSPAAGPIQGPNTDGRAWFSTSRDSILPRTCPKHMKCGHVSATPSILTANTSPPPTPTT
jgi:hypothetical protein